MYSSTAVPGIATSIQQIHDLDSRCTISEYTYWSIAVDYGLRVRSSTRTRVSHIH